MQLADLLNNIPTIHNYSEDSGRSPRLDNSMLRFLDRTVRPGMRTVETGAGISTILFAIKGAQHTCIVPDPRQIARIQDYCTGAAVSLHTTTFIAEPSEVGLPQLRGQTFELALIDGGHGFPLPFVAYCISRRSGFYQPGPAYNGRCDPNCCRQTAGSEPKAERLCFSQT